LRDDEGFVIKVKRTEGDSIDLDIRGVHFGLNKTFFELPRHLGLMQEQGVERGILSLATPFIDYSRDGKSALTMARRYNDALAASIAGSSDRFGAWGFLPMQDPVAAAGELRRCVKELGFVGGHIASNVQGVYLHDPRFVPVF